jgi:coniferyl-aldehyde dehydrogenase
LFDAQRAAFAAEGAVSARVRVDRLQRCIGILVDHEKALCDAAAADFGQRPSVVTRTMDIMPAVLALKHARDQVRRWMKPQRRRVFLPLGAPGVRAGIVYQPLGVIGVISPWNFPISLCLGPLAGILAAGNRCLIKPSELTPATSQLLQRLVAASFDERELAVMTGDAEVAVAFSALPFDHLLFTGSTAVGRKVMSAAAANLVPLTLELGGKCPTIISRSADMARAVDRLLIGKFANAGQTCIAPDHVYVPKELVGEFVAHAHAWVARAYPGMPANPDYTGIVSERHMARLQELLDDAETQNAHVVTLGGAQDAMHRQNRLFPPALVLEPTAGMRVMREEIFGPVLPVLGYEHIGQAIDDINRRPRPLALYYFGRDSSEQAAVLTRTISGGVTINDVLMHFLAEDLPFGGVGESGMGAYHGEHGFRHFSHARAVFQQTRLDLAGLAGLRPPYGWRLNSFLRLFIRK